MTPNLATAESQPWYRQFWPWFLIFLPGSVVVAAFATLFIANKHSDDLVVDDYYKNGLAINQRLEKDQRAVELGLTAQLTVSAADVRLRLSGSVAAEQLRLQFSHPLEADRDFTLMLGKYSDGGYSAALPQALAPNWHWVLDSGTDSAWRLQGELAAAQFVDDTGR